MEEKKLVPKRRFEGFTNDWELRKLGELAEIKDSARISNKLWQEKGIPYLRSSDLANEKLQGELFISKETYEGFVLKTGSPQKGDVLFTSGGKVGVVHHKEDESPVYVQGGAILYIKTSTSKLLDGSFMSIYFMSPRMQKYMDVASSGGTIKHFTLKPANASPIKFPYLIEQRKIGEFFKVLDERIANQEGKIAKVKALKAAYLTEMFPQEGETVPKRRFKGFEREWDIYLLKDLIEYEFKGKTNANMSGGTTPYLETEYLNGGKKSSVNVEADTEEEDVIILWDGSNAGTVYHGFKGALGSTLKSYKPKYSGSFLYYYLKKHQELIFIKYRTPNIPHVINTFTEEFKVIIPSKEEQQKIGNFFKNLDNQIEMEEKKLDKLQKMKEAYLGEMFV